MLLGSLAALDVGYCPDCPAFFLLDKEGESCDHQVAPLTDQQRDDLHDAIRERLLAAPCSHGPLPSEPSEAAIKAAFPHVFGRGPEPDPERDGPELAALEAGLIAAYAAERSPEGPAPEGGKTS
jgi:hypothetical protein